MWRHSTERHHDCFGECRPLAHCLAGQRVVIKMLVGGQRMKSRLETLGFLPGMSIDVVQSNRFGPQVIRIKDCQLAIGRGMSHHILVA